MDRIIHGDSLEVLRTLPNGLAHTCVTSPPYWGLRDYGVPESEWPAVSFTPMPGLPEIEIPAWIGCLGLEPTPEMFVGHIVLVFREVRRVLRDDGTLWLNLGDSYSGSAKGAANYPGNYPKQNSNKGSLGVKGLTNVLPKGLKPKDLIGIPWRVVFALQADGWYLRMDNVWSKPNPMPESVKDRPTKAHEYVFLLSKSEHYYYNREAIMEPLAESSIARLSQDLEKQKGSDRANGGAKTNGTMKAVFTPRGSKGIANKPLNSGRRNEDKEFVPPTARNKRSVWTVPTAKSSEAHFAIFPEKLIEPCILAGSPEGGKVLDPFGGTGTTRKVALENNRECTIIEIGEQYVEMANRRTKMVQPKLQFI